MDYSREEVVTMRDFKVTRSWQDGVHQMYLRILYYVTKPFITFKREFIKKPADVDMEMSFICSDKERRDRIMESERLKDEALDKLTEPEFAQETTVISETYVDIKGVYQPAKVIKKGMILTPLLKKYLADAKTPRI